MFIDIPSGKRINPGKSIKKYAEENGIFFRESLKTRCLIGLNGKIYRFEHYSTRKEEDSITIRAFFEEVM